MDKTVLLLVEVLIKDHICRRQNRSYEMSFLKNIFGPKDGQIKSYQDFWNWFEKEADNFYNVVKQKGNIEKSFFRKLSPKLDELKEGFFYLTGMYNDTTVELVFASEGIVKNFVFVEELVNAAPQIKGWKFTALKPPLNIEDVNIEMAGHQFNSEKLSFYYAQDTGYPDEIDITVVHDDYSQANKDNIINGTYVFLDNYLGELNFATTIDNLKIIGKDEAQKELIPIHKLKDFLIWREKEFVEKYDEIRHDTENDTYSALEAELKNGNRLLAIINTDLLKWDGKASHPWILKVEIGYNGKDNNGMPDKETYKMLNEIEESINGQLKDYDGYLNVGRQTAESVREIYFACRDFRKPSKILHQAQLDYAGKLDINYNIYKDKYWQTFNRFMSSPV
jgi:hypothetical protein